MAQRWNEKRGPGARRRAVKIEPLGSVPGDLPGTEWRVERRHWPDGSSCYHAVLWGEVNGVVKPFYPVKMIQIPWEDAERVLGGLLELRQMAT